MIRRCEQIYQTDYYTLIGENPESVITLKQPLGGIPPGTKLLWVCGDDKRLGGIKLDSDSKSSDNAYLRRDSFQIYAQWMHSREEMER